MLFCFQVGGLTTSPSQSLPGPLARFFDDAGANGVIVTSLGPFVFVPNRNLEDKLLNAFRQLQQRVLLRLNVSRQALAKTKNVQVGYTYMLVPFSSLFYKTYIQFCFLLRSYINGMFFLCLNFIINIFE
jgi:hypothetical protein